jgi:hypothetical protein
MELMANNNIKLRKDEQICVFYESNPNIIELLGDGSVLFHKDKSDEGGLQKGIYVMEPAVNHPHDGLIQNK